MSGIKRQMRGYFEESSSGPTCNSQVGVCLDLSRQIAGEALKHASVVRQETIDLQAAPYQNPVPGDLDRTDGHRILVPHDIWLRRSCTKRRGLLFFPASAGAAFVCRFLEKWREKKREANESAHLALDRGYPPPFPSLR